MLMGKNKSKIILFLLILFLALFLRLNNLPNSIEFAWDQERDAYAVKQILIEKHPLLIGPRVVNDNGFIYCVHSTAWPQKAVAIEPLAISKVFMDSKVHYTGKLLSSKRLLKKWRVKEKIEMK